MIFNLLFFVGFPIFIIRIICRFEDGKFCVSRNNLARVGLVLMGYACIWLLLRIITGSWSTSHCGGFAFLLAYLFPVLLSIGLQSYFRCIWVVSLLQLLGIVLEGVCLMKFRFGL